ncbi:MAG: hypothetical protein B6D72_16900 [gamma proteobacterium symbiont of Ctena orbiculata]|nr:MAG: hypothetical protein B6D72_16900 [gamma proteobacterium symbiont of Ctena orbiculata]PVV18082.1 MAG: hypothetical protein B6D74_17030 [gamma proteobacterium symbiont of Ctena orbiculata]
MTAVSLFRRLTVSFRSHLDEAVSRIENHDAVIDAALQESRDAIARLKLQQSQVNRKIDATNKQLDALHHDLENWVRRAKNLANSDESQAIACLERRDRCAEQIDQLQQQQEEYSDMAFRLANNLKQLEQKLISDEQRLQEFRGRDLSTKAENMMQHNACFKSVDLEQAFDRWELAINRNQMQYPVIDPAASNIDTLEERMQREERLAAHKAELEKLKEDES